MIKVFSTLFFAMLIHFGFAQDFDKISDALGSGNVSAITSHLDSQVEFTIDDMVSKIGRGDAENKLRAFFNDHTPRSIKSVHKGVSKSDVHYMISEMLTNNGMYRVTVYIHKSSDIYLIKSLEIEKQ